MSFFHGRSLDADANSETMDMMSPTQLQWPSVASVDAGVDELRPNVGGLEAVESSRNDGMEAFSGGGIIEEEPMLSRVFEKWQHNHRLAAKRDEATVAAPASADPNTGRGRLQKDHRQLQGVVGEETAATMMINHAGMGAELNDQWTALQTLKRKFDAEREEEAAVAMKGKHADTGADPNDQWATLEVLKRQFNAEREEEAAATMKGKHAGTDADPDDQWTTLQVLKQQFLLEQDEGTRTAPTDADPIQKAPKLNIPVLPKGRFPRPTLHALTQVLQPLPALNERV